MLPPNSVCDHWAFLFSFSKNLQFKCTIFLLAVVDKSSVILSLALLRMRHVYASAKEYFTRSESGKFILHLLFFKTCPNSKNGQNINV